MPRSVFRNGPTVRVVQWQCSHLVVTSLDGSNRQIHYTLGAQCCLHTIISPETLFSQTGKQSENRCHQFLKLWAISCSNDQHQHGYLLDVAYLSILIYIFSCKSNICSSCMAGFSLDLFFISLMILYLTGKKETNNPGEFSLVHRCCTINNNQMRCICCQ